MKENSERVTLLLLFCLFYKEIYLVKKLLHNIS